MTSPAAKRLLSVLAFVASFTYARGDARADCDGACGAGCGGSCSYTVITGDPSCNADGSMTIPIKDGYSCWTSPCCQFHDACLADAGCYSCNAEALACNDAAVSYYGPPNDGCAACAGPGFAGCDPHGSWGWFDERNYSRTLSPGEDGNSCPRPPPCHMGDGCPPPSDPCVGAMDCGGNACACGVQPPPPCTGACYPLCGQPDGCGNTCSSNDDVCNGCGYTNACGRDCGECPPPPPPPPPCDPTCNSCGTTNGCGDYCGDCYEYWCDWNWEGYCCWDTYGSYWCEYYYP
jgi:hypothetical protein